MKKVTLLLVMLTMGITNAQTFNFSCTQPLTTPPPVIVNNFPADQIARLERAGFEEVVENLLVHYIKNFDNNRNTIYIIKSEINGFNTWFWDDNDFDYAYATDASNRDGIVDLIDKMLRAPLGDESYITSEQRQRLITAGFRWNDNTEAFEFIGHYTGELSLRSIGSLYEGFFEGQVVRSNNFGNLVSRAIETSEMIQTPYDAAITAFPGAVEATNSLYAAERPNPDTQPNRFRVFRKSDDYTVSTIFVEPDTRYHAHKANNDPYSPQIRFDTAQEALNGALNAHAQVNGYFEYTSAEVAMMINQGYEFNNSAWRNGDNNIQYLPVTNQWSVVRTDLAFEARIFDYSSVAVGYLLTAQVGVPGFTGEEKRNLEDDGWVYNNDRFNKADRNQVRIIYISPGVYHVQVNFLENSSWSGAFTRDSVAGAIQLANEQINRVL